MKKLNTAAPAPAGDDAPLIIGVNDAAAETEAKARALGWLPEDEYEGDGWLPAEEFLAHADSLEAQLAQAQHEITALKEQLAGRDAAYADQLQRMQRANDVAITRLRDETYANSAAQPAPNAALHPETASWLAQNPWFHHDTALRGVALALYCDAEVRFPNGPESNRLRFVDERLALAFPERFTATAAETAPAPRPAAAPSAPAVPQLFRVRDLAAKQAAMPAVEGGARRGSGSFARGRTTDLPAEARQAAQRFIKLGLFKNLDDYANSYFETQNNG
jgi:hypothetical protein